MNIQDYREQINSIDKQIVELLEKRLDIAGGIGQEKKRQGLPVFDEVREKERIETVRELAKNEKYKDRIEQIYIKLMDETKLWEKELMGLED